MQEYGCRQKINALVYLNISQLDALNFIMSLFHASTCFEYTSHRQEAKIILYSLWYHDTETSEWSKIAKITKITKIILVILDHSLVSV